MLCKWLILQPEWYIQRGIRNVLNTETYVHGQLLLCFQTERRFLIQRWQTRFRCQIPPNSRQRLIRRSLGDLKWGCAFPEFMDTHALLSLTCSEKSGMSKSYLWNLRVTHKLLWGSLRTSEVGDNLKVKKGLCSCTADSKESQMHTQDYFTQQNIQNHRWKN